MSVDRRRHLRPRLLRQPAPPRPGDAAEEARVPAARVRRRGAARRRRRLRLRRPQPAAQHGREPARLRGAVRPAAEGGEGARPDVSRRAVSDAGLDDRRQLAQQHRLHARRLDRAAPDLREARRRRPVPHPLRSVARDPDGAGHALDLPVPEGRRATASSSAASTSRARSSTRQGVAAWGYGGQTMERGDWIDGKPSAAPGRPGQRVEEAGRARRARAAGHGAPRSAGLPAEPDRRLARSPARRARAAAARRRQHAPRRRARVPAGAHPGSRAAEADPPGSIAFVRRIDEAAACMYALQHEVLPAQGIPVQGVGRQPYRS